MSDNFLKRVAATIPWQYIVRRTLYCIPVYLGILFLLLAILRVRDPVPAFMGKNASAEDIALKRQEVGLDRPFLVQYASFIGQLATFDFSEDSWQQKGRTVGEIVGGGIGPTLALTVPALFLTTMISVSISLIAAWFRGRSVDRTLVFLAVLGMSISFLVYIIVGQYWLGYSIRSGNFAPFAISGYQSIDQVGVWAYFTSRWPYYCLLPVLISVIVSMGYDTRFYRAVMVEESQRDYIVTARAKGAGERRIMFVHLLKNAMIPVITRVSISIPFLITGSFLLEMYFRIPGVGRALITAVNQADFPVVQVIGAIFAGAYLVTNLLTDVLYAMVDPRVRLS
ncbi:MAG: ABC transporter permease [Fuerstiella sp.]|jgi:peptide/nickel transport system permease protein